MNRVIPSTDQERAPYADALLAHSRRDPTMLMVPAHAATEGGLSSDLADFIGARALALDIPQLIDGIDVGSQSPLVESLELAAEAWSAQRTWFLTNGSSQGNRMALTALASAGSGDTIIAQRSAHSSLLDGLVITGMKPRWIMPEIDRRLGINHGVTPEALQRSFEEATSAGAHVSSAYVISPSYFGAVADIEGLAKVAHSFGAALVVDAAWGAHFGSHVDLPAFPTVQGADIVITSTHKMGGSLGQSAMLHLAPGEFAAHLEPFLERAYNLTQTTSASSLLLGSMDIARRSLVLNAPLIGESIAWAARFRDRLRAHPSLGIVSDGFSEFPSIAAEDPLRISIDLTNAGVSGYRLRAELAAAHATYFEIATSASVVAFVGPGKVFDEDRLMDAIDEVLTRSSRETGPDGIDAELPVAGEVRLSPREAYFADSEIVPADEVVGRVSADSLAAYPPGIPNIAPGEVISRSALEFLQKIASSPIGYVRGAIDPELSAFRVVKQ